MYTTHIFPREILPQSYYHVSYGLIQAPNTRTPRQEVYNLFTMRAPSASLYPRGLSHTITVTFARRFLSKNFLYVRTLLTFSSWMYVIRI